LLDGFHCLLAGLLPGQHFVHLGEVDGGNLVVIFTCDGAGASNCATGEDVVELAKEGLGLQYILIEVEVTDRW
jgi:hypothetical protein